MTSRDIFFNFPLAGFLIVLLIAFVLGQFILTRYRNQHLSAYTSSFLLPRLMIPRSPILRWTKVIGWGIIWVLSCLALMQPFGNIGYSSLSDKSSKIENEKASIIPHEVIFLVDTSASMRVPDGSDGETRLESAKNIMEDVLRQLHGQTVSLYAFTSQLIPVVPATLDYIFTRLSIKDLHIDQGDARFAPVLAALKEQAFPEPSSKHYTVIMLTDGGDSRLEQFTGAEQIKEREAILNAIDNPQQLHVHFLTVGLGSLKPEPIPQVTFNGQPVLSQLEPEILKELASRERGQYYMAIKTTSWNLAQKIALQIEKNEQEIVQGISKREVATAQKEEMVVDLYYQIPLGLALLFYFLNILLPDVPHLSVICLLMFPIFSLRGENDLAVKSLQAEAFFEAGDDKEANRIYKELLANNLLQWQKARLFYNLGTIELAQQRPIEALKFFQKIDPVQLSLPSFARDLFLNMGIAYLQYAQSLGESLFLDEQSIFIEQSLKFLDRAKSLDCQLQKEERFSSSCQPSYLLGQWINIGQMAFHSVYHKREQQWEEQAKTNFSLDRQDVQQLRLNYGALFLQERLSSSNIKELLTQFDGLKEIEDEAPALKEMQENLRRSLTELEQHRIAQARFFILASFSQFDSHFQNKRETSAEILKQGIKQAHLAFQMFILSEMMEKEDAESIIVRQILQSEQKNILKQVSPLISSVLTEQDKRFHQEKNPRLSCQKSPWDKVIPLYTQGYMAANHVNEDLRSSPFDSQSIFAHQEQTIKDWEQALKLILKPPEQEGVTKTMQKDKETVRMIQEMHLQDQSQKENTVEELHSW